ncbi:MAG: hypothetical protein ACR2RF_06035 [Geminicoccaceae bacterium]
MSEREFVEGMCRNDQDAARSHFYERVDGDYWPMCGYGWNRSDGHAFSIFRGHRSMRGTCKICLRNIAADKPSLKEGWEHPTKWL